MTGFGFARGSFPQGEVLIEIQTVNRKFFDLQIQLPEGWTAWESVVRQRVSSRILRGSVQVRVRYSLSGQGLEAILPKASLLREWKGAWEALATSIGYPSGAVSWEFLLENVPKEVPSFPFEDLPLEEVLEKAIFELQLAREKEGDLLQEALLTVLSSMEERVSLLPSLFSKSKERQQEKIQKRIYEILQGDEERILREAALLLEKCDATEELDRLAAHIVQFRNMVLSKQEEMGKALDFLSQEMLREANTMGSKMADILTTPHILAIKGEIEKLKEQIQNVQ